MKRGIASFLCSFVLSCGGSREAPQAVDAGPSPTSSAAIALIKQHPTLRRDLERASAFALTAGKFVSAGAALGVELPTRATGTVRLERKDETGSFIELVATDARDVPGRTSDGAVVYADAAGEADVVYVASPQRVEELRVVRTAAVHHAHYLLRTGPRIASVRTRDDRIECLDDSGSVRIGTDVLYALDAEGARLPVTARVTPRASNEWEVAIDVDGSKAVAPIVIDPAWTTVASMKYARSSHGSILLDDGKVLVAGGGTGLAISNAEIYDPAVNTWTEIAAMNGARFEFNFIRLDSGKILAPDGFDPELFDQTSKTWTKTGPRTMGSNLNTAVKVTTGKVVAFANQSHTAMETSIFDPASATWTVGKPLPVARGFMGVAALPGGKVLVVGGRTLEKPFNNVDIYDPVADAWTVGTPRPVRGSPGDTVRLADGRILVVGGYVPSGSWIADVDLYDPSTGSWTRMPAPEQLNGPRAVALSPTRVLVEASGATFVLDVSTAKWSRASWSSYHSNASLIALSGSRALKTGGGNSADVWMFETLALGAACGFLSPGDCGSLNCVDGVCCNSVCNGACEKCDVAGSAGTCSPLTGAPRPGMTCEPYAACVAGACPTSCSADSDCVASAYCASGVCKPRLANGDACTADNQCASRQCFDGVCCNNACSGQCEACDVPGSVGTCVAVTGTPRGTRTACGDPTNPCEKVCNGTTRATCVYLPAGTSPCGTNSCSGGTETHASTCNGVGACGDVPKSCGAYACGTLACKTACGTSSDCAAGHICASGACIVAPGLGSPCTDGSACSTGFCVDSVCCAVAACGPGSTCAATGKAGRCSKLAGVTCSTNDECATGNCVDGVCCDGACTGQCEACNLPGQVGKCAAVRGAPRGSRAACAADATNTCASKVCDGTSRTECAAFVGADVSCRAASCADGEATAPASCDGKGACPALDKKSCGGFACDGAACRLICSTDEHCAKDYFCSAGACRPKVPTCSAEFTESIAVDGTKKSCAPFRCRAGECPTTCGSSSDCLAGTVCSDGQCVAPAAAEDGGGCTSSPRSPRAPLAALFALSVLVVARMRRARTIALIAAVTALGCRKETPASSDASQVIASVARVPELAARVGQGGRLILGPSGYRPTPRIARDGAFERITPPADATFPLTARAPLRIGRGETQLEIEALDLNDVGAEVIDGATVHRGVAPATDLVFASAGRAVEELRLLRDATAPTTFRWRLRLGTALTEVIVRDARITLLDRDGHAHITTEPLVAIDAGGRHRTLAVSAARSDDGWLVTASLQTASLSFPIVVDPLWSTLAEIAYPGTSQWTALLPGGDLLYGNHFATAERYRFSTGTWLDVSATTLFGPRAANAGSKVFLTGLNSLTSSAEGVSQLFDPATNTWSPTGSPAATRSWMFVASLPGGKVMVGSGTAGYSGSTVLATTEIYDPTSGTFTAAASMAHARTGARAVLLNGGKLLVAGGTDAAGTAVTAAEIYDSTAGTWSAAGTMSGGTGVLSSAAGGTKALFVGSSGTSLFDLATLSWESVPSPLTKGAYGQALAPLPSGRVLIAGDQDSAPAAYAFDPGRKTWLTAGKLAFGRTNPTAQPLADGRVAIVGGSSPSGYAFEIEVFQEQPNGTACGGGGECTSGNCVDGYCCNSACQGACDACNVTGSLGTCSPISGTPTPGHASCAPYKTCISGACDSACTSDAECCTTVDSCCKDNVCSSSFAGAYCNGSACVAKKATGQACARTGECLSGFCVDGVCCDTACTGQCEACAETGKVGTCSAIAGTPKGGRPACTGITVGGECGVRCDGVNAKLCTYPAAGVTKCSTNACAGGIETHESSCDGVGRCNDVTKTCGAYACGTSACRTTCTANTDCATGFYCNAGACVPSPSLGQPCSSTKPCLGSLFCTDGYCCGEASCGAGKSCGLPASRGTCAKVNGTACATEAECGSGNCVDGVCCDAPCSGQCQACNETGSAGTCVAIKGAPRGSRTACATVAGAPCESTLCDGADGSRCAGYVGADTSCREAKCEGGVATSSASCDGAGACPALVTTPCAPYKCDGAGRACATTCTTSDDCTGGFVCLGGTCQKSERRCSDDGAALLDPEGKPTSCAPFLCRAAECLSKCESSADCVSGTACDPSGRCLPPTVETGGEEDSGGCAIDHRAGRSGSAVGLVLFAVSVLAARRRRHP